MNARRMLELSDDNAESDDARLVQAVAMKKHTRYPIACWASSWVQRERVGLGR